MSGPIVRTGTSPKFWENWDRIFGDEEDTPKKKSGKATKSKKKTSAKKKTPAKKKASAKKKSAKKKKGSTKK